MRPGATGSEDWGETWAPIETLNQHPYRPYWTGTGGGDSCLHSVDIDPRDPAHVYVSISMGGTYETLDAGKSWDIVPHRLVATTELGKKMMQVFEDYATQEARIPPNVDPAAADEFHKFHLDPKDPDRLWGQAHIGTFRLDRGSGSGWVDVTEGLPSFHGFPLAVTKREPDAVYTVPLAFEDDNFRVVRDQFAVYRTRDRGATWDRLTDGLPGPHDYQSVYREGLDTDGLDQEGVYVGTSNGQVYASTDGGDHWQRLPGTLPPVLSVTCHVA